MKILVAQLNPTIGDLAGNQKKILQAIAFAKSHACDLVLTSELALTGYPPEDFLLLPHFVKDAELSLQPIIAATKGIAAIIGSIRTSGANAEKPLYNTAAICYDGKLLGYQDKMLLPTYDVFDERRYFEPAQESLIWKIGSASIGVTICEDLWQHSGMTKGTSYAQDPVEKLKLQKLDLVLNLSASPFHVGKLPLRFHVCREAARTLATPLVLCNQVGGNDSLIFDGHSLALDQQGALTHMAKGFEEDLMIVDTAQKTEMHFQENRLGELYDALVLGLRDYFHKSGFTKACVGLSGGIDSALVACLAVEALGANNVQGVAMPSRYSLSDSLEDAQSLAKNLAIDLRIIPIEGPFQSYLDLLEPHFEKKVPDITEENLQARIRGMILMALSNKLKMIVLSTGNKSELAMGYSTLYGDMCGGLAVISDLTKEQAYALSRWINAKKPVIPERTLSRPPSAELRPNQRDTDSLPEYHIVDAVLIDYIEKGLSPKEIALSHNLPLALVNDLVIKIHANEYKRRQSPPGLRVTEKAFSIGRRFPIVQKWA
jgi:NAD+ synthase (glutamine-hydrolysing)